MSGGLFRGRAASFDAAKYTPSFSPDDIREHMALVLELVEELDPPADLRVHVFGVVQAMCSSMAPVEQSDLTVANGAMAPALRTIPGQRR